MVHPPPSQHHDDQHIGGDTFNRSTESAPLATLAVEPAQSPSLMPKVAEDFAMCDLILDTVKKKLDIVPKEQNISLNHDEIYLGCIQARNELIKTANKYRKKTGQLSIDAAASHTWSDVDEAVQSACSDLDLLASRDKKISGATGRVKQAFRTLCRHAGACQTAIALIPEDAFGLSSALCGGLKVIFSAMRQATLYREELLRALEELPSLLNDSSELCSSTLFKNDKELHRRRAALYIAIFIALRHILHWFLNSSILTGVKLIVDPTRFAEKLKEHMDSVKLRSQLFQSQAIKLSLILQPQSIKLQYLTAQNLQAVAARAELISIEAIQSQAVTMRKLDELDALVRGGINTSSRTLRALHSRPLRISETSASRSTSLIETINGILYDFFYDGDMVSNDCSNILKILNAFGARTARNGLDEERVLAIQSDPRLRAWLVHSQPSMLLFNSRSRPRPRSEISVVTAKIASRLLELYTQQDSQRNAKLVIPLLYFCGEHRDWRKDPNANAEELAMSLLLQLIDRSRGTVTSTILQQVRNMVIPGDVDAICSALGVLVMALPKNIFVVIILDGLRFFMQLPGPRQQQTRQVVESLVMLFRRRPTATLKLLFSSPVRSESLEDLFKDNEITYLSRDVAVGGTGNDRAWTRPLTLRILG